MRQADVSGAREGCAFPEPSPRRAGSAGRSLRIAVVSYSLPIPGEKRGGVDRVAHDVAHGLARRGHQVTVWSYDPAPPGAAYRVRPLPGKRFTSSWLGLRLTYGYLGNIVNLLPDYSGADVIITHGDSILLPLARKPWLRVMHGSALGEAFSARSPWRFAMQLGVYAQELTTALLHRHCVGVSRNTRRFNPFVRRTIPNGIDLSVFEVDSGTKSAHPSVLFVGTLDGRKRGRLLVEWFRRDVLPRHPTARLTIVGPPGPAVEGVEYRTGIDAGELAELYRSTWVYASPSSYEGFGLPYVEAMASGTPVVATANPGSLEVLDQGRFGLMPSDEEFGRVLADLLDDAQLRSRLAASGIERAREYSLETMLDRYEAILVDIARPSRVGTDQ